MSPRLAFAIEAALAAGRSTLAHFQTGVAVEVKSDETPVTIADQHAERLIRDRIALAYPGEAVLGEEEGGLVSPTGWVIDPIDGTKSFISGVPLYATLLSYEEDGTAQVGVCYFPALDEMLYAERGGGAFWNGRPCRVSSRASIDRSVLACGGLASMVKYGRMEPFLELSKRTMATRTWSDAYGHALVATGRVDAMADPIVNAWDVSALRLIVREAGGRFTDFNGTDANGSEALSSNGLVHDELVAAFRV